jgi:hypothetical protein
MPPAHAFLPPVWLYCLCKYGLYCHVHKLYTYHGDQEVQACVQDAVELPEPAQQQAWVPHVDMNCCNMNE